jgi:hypothetical protein
VLRLASPSGIAQAGLDRQWQLGEQEPEQQRIPNDTISILSEDVLTDHVPKLGCQQAFVPTTRTAFRSCSWIWPRYRNIEGFSFGEK